MGCSPYRHDRDFELRVIGPQKFEKPFNPEYSHA